MSRNRLLPLITLVFLLGTAFAQNARTIPSGTEIRMRTDTAIPAKPDANATYKGKISRDVIDSSGAVAIPQGTPAQLVAVPTTDGKDTVLDLDSVTISGRTYRLATQTDTSNSTPGGLGVNKRTGKYVGGGAAVGALLGAIIGGGKGAALGAVLGGAGGAGAQVYTGRDKEVPPETELSFKLAQNLELQPVRNNSPASRR